MDLAKLTPHHKNLAQRGLDDYPVFCHDLRSVRQNQREIEAILVSVVNDDERLPATVEWAAKNAVRTIGHPMCKYH